MNDSSILKISIIFTIASIFFIFLFVLYLDEDLRGKIFRKRKNNISKNRKRCEEKMLKAASRGSTAKSEIDIASIYFISAMIEVSDLSLVKTNYALICDIFSYAIWVMKTMNNRFSFFEKASDSTESYQITQEEYADLITSCVEKFQICYPEIVGYFSKNNLITFFTRRFLYFDKLYFSCELSDSNEKFDFLHDRFVSAALLKELDTNILSALNENTPIYLSVLENYLNATIELRACNVMAKKIFSDFNPHLVNRQA